MLVALGQFADNCPCAEDLAAAVGIAPVTDQSGRMRKVYRRLRCDKHTRQTFVEWVKELVSTRSGRRLMFNVASRPVMDSILSYVHLPINGSASCGNAGMTESLITKTFTSNGSAKRAAPGAVCGSLVQIYLDRCPQSQGQPCRTADFIE
ncbi:MAG: transposase [Opitutaceae bacterium]|nr:transposase [Opitutaceae bacterium]